MTQGSWSPNDDLSTQTNTYEAKCKLLAMFHGFLYTQKLFCVYQTQLHLTDKTFRHNVPTMTKITLYNVLSTVHANCPSEMIRVTIIIVIIIMIIMSELLIFHF